MIKKRLANGEPCPKCSQVETALKEKGHWEAIDEVIWAEENDSESEGMKIADRHSIKLAPFFLVKDGNEERVYTSYFKFIKKELESEKVKKSDSEFPTVESLKKLIDPNSPQKTINETFKGFGDSCAIAFSGAEDVVLIDMAKKSGYPFTVFCLDTGRLHPQTYRFIEKVADHYAIEIAIISPDNKELEPFTKEKGLFSFYKDGHSECCSIRKVKPLLKTLKGYRAWMTGQRIDQNPSTRGTLDIVAEDSNEGFNGSLITKVNPLVNWSQNDVWAYIRYNNVPYNELHDMGFISIGCEPCTREHRPGEHERASRWWWEEGTKRECGLHISK